MRADNIVSAPLTTSSSSPPQLGLPLHPDLNRPPSAGSGTAAQSLQPTPNAPIAGKDKAKTRQPIELKARDVVVDVLRGEKHELQELNAVGKVHVHQNGEKPGDKGVDIQGETLNLRHFAEGDILKVYGDEPTKRSYSSARFTSWAPRFPSIRRKTSYWSRDPAHATAEQYDL